MDKPTMKTKIAITFKDEKSKLIHFYATPEIAESLKEFGLVETRGDKLALLIDARFDFTEVVEYAESLA